MGEPQPRQTWREDLKIDPVPALFDSGNEAVAILTRRHLMDDALSPVEQLWSMAEPARLVRRQGSDGSWRGRAPRPNEYPPNRPGLLATFKNVRTLVERYEFTIEHEAIARAAEHLLSFQTTQGDIRGFLANQYATYYTGDVLALLIRAGLVDDPRIERAMQWLLPMRQDDGGWTVPILTHRLDRATKNALTSGYAEPVEPDRTAPSSHNWTDMALRPFAAHPRYRASDEVRRAALFLKSSFFEPDAYTSYRHPRYWTRFAFWWPNLLTAMESLVLLGFEADDPDMKRGTTWFVEHQMDDGMWNPEYRNGTPFGPGGRTDERAWLALRICRLLKRLIRPGGTHGIDR